MSGLDAAVAAARKAVPFVPVDEPDPWRRIVEAAAPHLAAAERERAALQIAKAVMAERERACRIAASFHLDGNVFREFVDEIGLDPDTEDPAPAATEGTTDATHT